jgi:hypothetical protein
MTHNGGTIMDEDVKGTDFVDSQMFKRSAKECRRIEFSPKWHARRNKDKIEYLIKLASSLNHAAQELQKERNKLNDLCFDVERQLVECTNKRTQDQMMIHQQLQNENSAKQALLEENQMLRKEIKELEKKLKQKGE